MWPIHHWNERICSTCQTERKYEDDSDEEEPELMWRDVRQEKPSLPEWIFDVEPSTSPLVEQVFGNDLILENIMSHIEETNNRLSMDYVCRRWYDLNHRAKWILDEERNKLEVVFAYYEPLITVFMADVSSRKMNCCVSDYRMEPPVTAAGRHSQPRELMEYLQILTKRLGKYVRTLCIGGQLEGTRNYGPMSESSPQMMITKDLLVWINESLPNLDQIELRQCFFDIGALEYLISTECGFQHRYRSLLMEGVWARNDRVENRVPELSRALVGNRVRKLELWAFSPRFAAGPIRDLLLEQKRSLDVVNLNFNNNDDVREGLKLVEDLNKQCNSMELRFLERNQENPIAFRIGKCRIDRSKLTGLHINTSCKFRQNLEDMGQLLQELPHMTELLELKLTGRWSRPSLTEIMAKAVVQLKKLKIFWLTSDQKVVEELNYMVANLPISLEEINFDEISIRPESFIAASKKGLSPKKLSLTRNRYKQAAKFLDLVPTYFPLLEELRTDCLGSVTFLRRMSAMRNLSILEFTTKEFVTAALERELRLVFHYVKCERLYYRWNVTRLFLKYRTSSDFGIFDRNEREKHEKRLNELFSQTVHPPCRVKDDWHSSSSSN